MQRAFCRDYLRARLLDGKDQVFGDAYAIFEGEALENMRHRLRDDAMRTPVFFTDNLSDRNLAVYR
jgi:hypothetical protein